MTEQTTPPVEDEPETTDPTPPEEEGTPVPEPTPPPPPGTVPQPDLAQDPEAASRAAFNAAVAKAREIPK